MRAVTESEPAAPPLPSRRLPYRLLFAIALVAILIWPLWRIGLIVFAANFHEVIPGVLYRGAQPTPAALEKLIRQHKIRTVLNVRGCCWPDEWYLGEATVCEQLDVNLEDVCFSAVHLPSRHELRLLVEALERAERPVFVHCRHGSDRTGIAAMAAKLLLDESDLNVAGRQLSLRYGHAPIGKTTTLDRFMNLYADWLSQTRQSHSAKVFRHWLIEEYRGGWCDAHFEKVERVAGEPKRGMHMQYRVVVKNTGPTDWQFRPMRTAGHHVTFKIVNDRHFIVHEGRAGMFDKLVRPGETIEVLLIVPPLREKGHYALMVDMIEEGHCWFHQTGSEMWQEEFEIRE
jgi:protein tyrosine phosphatase (PTP) superfamily phosphohydrolase (DUF442 family)